MCGIVGALSFGSSAFSIEPAYLSRMLDALSHRGPDGEGKWISDDRHVGLGHRRLAIVDLSHAADQPMSNENGSLWTVFNGEIYNHADIRAELVRIGGHTWKTDHSDTEVILHAFEQWGPECFSRFRGMFAIAIWDEKKKELWLVRDRIGIKPLYYSVHHGRITFASEIKALLRDPGQKREMNEEAMFHYLSFLATPPPQTLFTGISKLACGTLLKITINGVIREERYWDLWDNVKPLDRVDEEEIAERLISELRESVQLHKMSDVPMGVFLSGGIDSSTNAVLFAEKERNPINTFTIGYDAEYQTYQSETLYARRIARMVNANHHEQVLTSDHLIEFLPRMIYLQDEPIADPVCVPVYYVSKLARDHGIKVCQVGEGADELHFGYPYWRDMLRLQRLDDLPIPDMLKTGGYAVARLLGMDRRHKFEFLRRGAAGQPVFWGGAEAFTDSHKRRLLSPRLRAKFSRITSWDAIAPFHERFRRGAPDKSILNWMSYLDLNFRLPELLLMRVDKMSMGVALETRVPYLDHKFVEFSMSIPESAKTKGGVLKRLLKRAVRGLIPDEIIDRKKQGFNVPTYEWLSGRLGDRIRSEVGDFCDGTDILDRSEAMRVLDKGRGHQAWYLMNLAMWWKEYIGGAGNSALSGTA